MWGAKDWLSIPRDEQISTLCGGRENSRANFFRGTQSNKIAQYGLQTWLGIRHILKLFIDSSEMNYLFKYGFSVNSINFSTSFFCPILYPTMSENRSISTLKCCHKVSWELWLEAECSSSPDLSQDVWLCSVWQNVLLNWPPSLRAGWGGTSPYLPGRSGEVVWKLCQRLQRQHFQVQRNTCQYFDFHAIVFSVGGERGRNKISLSNQC